MQKTVIQIETIILANIETVWSCWVSPEHIVHWNFASPDWHCPKAENDLQVGGKFSYTMASKDGKMSFDFEGIFNEVNAPKSLIFTLGDGRKVDVKFEEQGSSTRVIEQFEAEQINAVELQKNGWQAILDNFKKYVEAMVE